MDQHLRFCFCFCFAVPGIKPRVSDIQGKCSTPLLSSILNPTFYFSRNELMCIYNFLNSGIGKGGTQPATSAGPHCQILREDSSFPFASVPFQPPSSTVQASISLVQGVCRSRNNSFPRRGGRECHSSWLSFSSFSVAKRWHHAARAPAAAAAVTPCCVIS